MDEFSWFVFGYTMLIGLVSAGLTLWCTRVRVDRVSYVEPPHAESPKFGSLKIKDRKPFCPQFVHSSVQTDGNAHLTKYKYCTVPTGKKIHLLDCYHVVGHQQKVFGVCQDCMPCG